MKNIHGGLLLGLSLIISSIQAHLFWSLIFLVTLAGCSASAVPENAVKPATITPAGENVDSPIVWHSESADQTLVLLSEKGAGSVLVFSATRPPKLIRRVAGMKRPNGLAVLANSPFAIAKELVFVTDRDANAVYAYSLPDFKRVGIFAEDLKRPMGITVYSDKSSTNVFAYIVQKDGEGDSKVVRYRIIEKDGVIGGVRELQFGKELTVGQETVMVDSQKRRVFVADEKARDIKIYDLNGKFLNNLGTGKFSADVEGIVVCQCASRSYIVVSDQMDVTEFEIFDNESLKHLGTVRGHARRTDGIAVTTEALPDFPGGLFVAQSDPDDTGGRHAEYYDLNQLLKAASLPNCR